MFISMPDIAGYIWYMWGDGVAGWRVGGVTQWVERRPQGPTVSMTRGSNPARSPLKICESFSESKSVVGLGSAALVAAAALSGKWSELLERDNDVYKIIETKYYMILDPLFDCMT